MKWYRRWKAQKVRDDAERWLDKALHFHQMLQVLRAAEGICDGREAEVLKDETELYRKMFISSVSLFIGMTMEADKLED